MRQLSVLLSKLQLGPDDLSRRQSLFRAADTFGASIESLDTVLESKRIGAIRVALLKDDALDLRNLIFLGHRDSELEH